jgi:hypothetical protein
MSNALPRNDYLRLLYEEAARKQRQLAERVRAASLSRKALAANFERRAAALDRLARPHQLVAPTTGSSLMTFSPTGRLIFGR